MKKNLLLLIFLAIPYQQSITIEPVEKKITQITKQLHSLQTKIPQLKESPAIPTPPITLEDQEIYKQAKLLHDMVLEKATWEEVYKLIPQGTIQRQVQLNNDLSRLQYYTNFRDVLSNMQATAKTNTNDALQLLRIGAYSEFKQIDECFCIGLRRKIFGWQSTQKSTTPAQPFYPRNEFETKLIKIFTERHPDKTQPITYTSIGSGQLFQDLVIITKLLNAGYQNINAFFIDHDYKKTDYFQHQFTQYMTMLTKYIYNDADVTSTFYTDPVEKYANKTPQQQTSDIAVIADFYGGFRPYKIAEVAKLACSNLLKVGGVYGILDWQNPNTDIYDESFSDQDFENLVHEYVAQTAAKERDNELRLLMNKLKVDTTEKKLAYVALDKILRFTTTHTYIQNTAEPKSKTINISERKKQLKKYYSDKAYLDLDEPQGIKAAIESMLNTPIDLTPAKECRKYFQTLTRISSVPFVADINEAKSKEIDPEAQPIYDHGGPGYQLINTYIGVKKE